MWKRAKDVIVGGNMLFSNRPELWLPEIWPAYFSKAEVCRVWDADGRDLIDMLFVVGQSTLGYHYPDVDAAVRGIIDATQEILAMGYLASTLTYVSTERTPGIVDGYFAARVPVFGLIRECENARDAAGLLKGPVCDSGFRRLA